MSAGACWTACCAFRFGHPCCNEVVAVAVAVAVAAVAWLMILKISIVVHFNQ